MARREFSAVCGRHLLVMHGKVGMKGDNLPGGTLLGSMLMSDRGAALAAPQQLALAHGMLSSFAPGAAAQPDPAAALEARVRWLGGQLGQVPLVHMLEAGTSALWSALTEQGVSWVARSPGGLRVIQDECPTNLNAVGKSVGYLPVGQPGDMPGLRPVAGGARALALWASGTEIGLPGRAGESAMRLVCARLIDTVSGEVAAQFFGLDQSAGFAGRCRHGRAVAGAAGRGQGRFPLHGQCLAGLAGRRWRPCAGAPGLDGRPIGRRLLAVGAFAGGGGGQGPLSGVAGVDRVKLTGRMPAGGAPEDVRDAGDGRRRLRRAVGNEAGKRKGASLPAFSRRRWACGGACRGPGRRRSRCWPAPPSPRSASSDCWV